jgi:hypothetical protein
MDDSLDSVIMKKTDLLWISLRGLKMISETKMVVFSLLIVLAISVYATAGPVPDTGQTQCYDNTGEIPCPQPGEPFFGQDANYQINPPSYTKLDAEGNDLPDTAASWTMVRDNVTGLIWEVKTVDGSVHDKDNAYTWYDSNPDTNGGNAGTPGDGTDTEDFINELNSSNYGGYSDWRLPTSEELQSIVDYGEYAPAIKNSYFPNIVPSDYWSSVTHINYTEVVLSVYFGTVYLADESAGDTGYGSDYGSGHLAFGYKSESNHVLAVRGGQSGVLDRLVSNSDETVTDTHTGLMWQKNSSANGMTWEDSINYCENLEEAGYSDWRLPTKRELVSITKLDKESFYIDTNFFSCEQYSYWSSTARVDDTGDAWRHRFDSSSGCCSFSKLEIHHVLAVRGGQSFSLDNLVISTPVQGAMWDIGSNQDIVWKTKDISGNVKISLSREGGKEGSFETIAESVENNGSYTWNVTGPVSVNCVLKIEPIDNSDKGTVQGLFSIDTLEKAWIIAKSQKDFTKYGFTLLGRYSSGVVKTLSTTWSSSDTSLATMTGSNVLTAIDNGRVVVTAQYGGKSYQQSIFLLDPANADDFESFDNDSQDMADALPAGEFWEAEMLTDDVDYYKFSLDQDALIEVAYRTQSMTADTKIEVLNSSGIIMNHATSTNGNLKTISCGLSQGTHYIKLSPAGDIDQENSYYIAWATVKYIQMGGTVPVSLGENKEQTLYSLSDTAIFSFDLSTKTGIALKFEPTSISADYQVELLNGEQAVLGVWSSENGESLSIPVSLNTGSYSCKVSQIQDVDAGSPFTLSLSESDIGLETEPNNTGAEATPLVKNQTIKGLIATGEGGLPDDIDVDYYRFSLKYPQFIELAFESESVQSEIHITLCKGDENNTIDRTVSINGQSVNLEVGLTGGLYLVKVTQSKEALQGPYDLDDQSLYSLTLSDSDQTNLEIEPNDNMDFANGLDTATSKQGRIYSAQDQDYFGFTLTEEQMITIHFSSFSTSADYMLHLMNGAESEIYQKESVDGSDVIIKSKPKAGTYYVRVKASGDADPYQSYTLSMTATTPVTALKKLSGLNLVAEKESLNISESLQLSVEAKYSDVTSTDVTSSCSYVSSDPSVLSITPGGLVTGLADGTAIVTAAFQGKAAGFTFTVGTPAGDIKQSYGSLIIVAGGSLSDNDSLKDATLYVTDLAYQKFKARNFTDEDIYFMTQTPFHDLDGDGYDDKIVDDLTPTVADIQSAITGWGKEQPSSGPLYIYMADHGVEDTFLVATGEFLTAVQLNTYLDSFQKDTGRDVILFIEACYSGSFMDDIQSDMYKRLVITSVDADNPAYLSSGGTTSFSSFLMSYLYKGETLEQSLNLAKADLQSVGLPFNKMSPQLQGDPSLMSLKVGGDFVLAGLFPEITGNTADQSLTSDDTLSLYADVSSAIGGLEVWAVIVPPDYTPPSVTGDYDTPLDELPKVFLVDEDGDKVLDGTYEGTYSDFPYNGVYKVIFYARDAEKNLVKTTPVNITITGGQDITTTTTSTTTTTVPPTTTTTTVPVTTTTTTTTTTSTTVPTTTTTTIPPTTTTTIPQLTETIIDMSSGWNLINSYLEPENPDIAALFFGIEDQIVSLWKWEDGKWAVYLMGQEDGGAAYAENKGFILLQEIHAGEGFWTNNTDSQYLTVSGTEPSDTSLALVSGWNLIGLKSDAAKSISDFVSGNEIKISSVWKWDNGKWAVYLPDEDDGGAAYAKSKGFSLLDEINPGEGFWVNCMEGITLD